MQFKKLALIVTLIILFTHSTIVPMFKFHTSYGPEYQQQFEKYMLLEQYEALRNTGFFTGIIGILIAFNYLGLSDKNNELEITTQYPYAKQWYNAMNLKYPQAHLQEKNFKKNQFKESAYAYNINFLNSSLQEINTIYKKQLEKKELTEQENLAIKKYEFLLLSQAGYIENNSSIKVDATWLMFVGITYNLIIPFLKLYHPIGGDAFEITTFERSINQFKFDYNILCVVQLLGSLIFSGCLNMYYENIADAFATAECDDESLEAIIQSCENEKHYAHRIKNLKNELTKRHN